MHRTDRLRALALPLGCGRPVDAFAAGKKRRPSRQARLGLPSRKKEPIIHQRLQPFMRVGGNLPPAGNVICQQRRAPDRRPYTLAVTGISHLDKFRFTLYGRDPSQTKTTPHPPARYRRSSMTSRRSTLPSALTSANSGLSCTFQPPTK